ncbi:MAG: hypothetical protein AAFX90_21900 [Pseudomonadota bacterium]
MSEDHDTQAVDQEIQRILQMPDEEIQRQKAAEEATDHAFRILEWMTYYHRPLSLFQEEEAGWVVADNSNNTVVASGETAFDALSRAHKRLEETV